MWLNLKNIVVSHLAQSIGIFLVTTISLGSVGYFVLQNNNSTDGAKDGESDTISKCTDVVKIGRITLEQDPAGGPEAWLRFEYTSSQTINCQYVITFYDNQQSVIRTISDVEDTFQSPNGQIYNGYSSTPYWSGMTAQVSVL